MTRKEKKINDFVHDYVEHYNGDSYEASAEKEDIAKACVNAIEWADETMLEKACDYLWKHCNGYILTARDIDEFKQKMKE